MVPGLSTVSSLSSLFTPAPPTSSKQDAKGSIPNPALIECESEDRQVRGDPFWALAHQTPQNGTMTTSGLLKLR